MAEKYLTNRNTLKTEKDMEVFGKRSADGAHEPRRAHPQENGSGVGSPC